MKNLIEVPSRKEIIYKGKFEYHLDQVILPNGKTATREYLHHPGAIGAVPLLDSGEIIMVRQYRYPTQSVILEIPAGKLEAGEDPEECVRRELMEEIGFEPHNIVKLTSVWTSPGFTDEIIHLYLATDLRPNRGKLDSDEFLEVVTMKKADLLEQMNSGAVIDGKTLLALSLLQLRNIW